MQKEKSNFILGIAVGIAVVSLIGLIMMSAVYFGGDNLDKPDNDKSGNVAKNNNKPSPAPLSNGGKNIDIKVADNDRIRGNKDAKITIMEFSDIQCPYCSKFHKTMKQVVDAYPDDVRWVYKHFPLDKIHSYARKAAEASECAGDQNKFWEYLDYLFENQASIKSNEYLTAAASAIGLNTSQFNSCLSSGKYTNKVNNDYSQGRSAGVSGTPGSLINGELIKGAVSFKTIKAKIEALK